MRHLRNLCLFFFVLSPSSCGKLEISNELNKIENFISEHPDSALVSLENIDTSYLSTSGLKARYSLLYSMALDKNFIDIDDDRIISYAVDYYEPTTDNSYKSLAYYYQGRVFYNGNRITEAILSFKKSLEYTPKTDYYHLGLIYSALADSYNLAFDDEEEFENASLSLDTFGHLGVRSYTDMARFRLARASHNNGYYDLADSLYNSIYSDTDTTSSVAIFSILNQVDNDLKSDKPDAWRDVKLLEFIKSSRDLSLAESYQYAYSLLLAGQRKQAQVILDALEGEDDNEPLDWRFRVEEELGNDTEALRLLKVLLSEQNEIVRQQLSQSVAKAEKEQYRMSAELLSKKSDEAKMRNTIALLVGLILLLFFVFLFKKKEEDLKGQNDRLHQAVEESARFIESLKSDAEEDNRRNIEKIVQIRRSYIALYQKQFAEISRYCDAQSLYRRRPVSDLVLDDVSRSVNELLSEVSDRNEMDKFERRINTDLDGLIDKIRSDFPKFNNEDIRFVCYLITGFDSASISFLMDMSKAAVRVKKHRIRAKLAEIDGPNGDLYKSIFF